jgi:hypothetical protein
MIAVFGNFSTIFVDGASVPEKPTEDSGPDLTAGHQVHPFRHDS